jgi:mannonate dehydratase
MNRRNLFKLAAASAAAGTLAQRDAAAQETAARAQKGLPSPKITDVQCDRHRRPPDSVWSSSKSSTDLDGLYGYGCGTFTSARRSRGPCGRNNI